MSFSQALVETDYFTANPQLGGEAVITKSTTTISGQETILTFEVEVPTKGDYKVSFWMFPTKLNDGSYADYLVKVNAVDQKNRLIASSSDWHSASLENGATISLVAGKNEISVIGKNPDVPSIEHIRLSKTNSLIDGSKYKAYRQRIEVECAQNDYAQMMTVVGDSIPSNDGLVKMAAAGENPLYNYTYALNVSFNYTFYKTVSFTQGQQVFVATTGVDNFSHILEIFSASTPESYSWSAMSNSNCMASLNLKIPATGLYYVRVRSYLNARSGFCNLNINGENYYERVPIYSTGFRCTQDSGVEYNTFTCYREGDPRLWIEEGTGIPGKISAYNDDYGTKGDYNWSLNSRIKKKYSRPVHAALLSAYGSYSPTGKCDLYIKCPNSTIMSSFGNLKADDAIQSSPASKVYNCISWSVGITSDWSWPPSYGSEYYDSNPLKAFDNFYRAFGYTRDGATKNNAVIALWAVVDANGNRDYKHASVTKGDGNAHGYDWESKPGQLMRTFHPCDALRGDGYGQIVEYYTHIDPSMRKSLAEQIADGSVIIEYVDFTNGELSIIRNHINSINAQIVAQFNSLYDSWNAVVENSPFSNPNQIAQCESYKQIHDFCVSNSECLYILYEKLGEKDVSALILINGLLLNSEEQRSIMDTVKSEISMKARSSVNVIRPLQSNFVSYVKKLLESDENIDYIKKIGNSFDENFSYSNSFEFEVTCIGSSLNIDIILEDSQKLALNILDLSGNSVREILAETQLNAGSHAYSVNSLPSGYYLVEVVVNGKLNIKKINIR